MTECVSDEKKRNIYVSPNSYMKLNYVTVIAAAVVMETFTTK